LRQLPITTIAGKTACQELYYNVIWNGAAVVQPGRVDLKKSILVKIQILAMVILAGCSLNSAVSTDSTDTVCYFLDVGEGAATLIDSPDLGKILVDTGNPASRIISKLNAIGITDVDSVIVTHPHPDHAGGIHNVMEFLSPQAIYDNGERLLLTDPAQRWYHEKVRLDPRYALLRAGDRMGKEDSVLEVLAPQKLADDWNENSLVLLLRVGRMKVLFMADGTFATEDELFQSGRDLSADILQVGHHGSSSSSSERFLEAVRPEFAVISVNTDNVNGYPAPQTLDRLNAQGAEILCTCEHGDIVFVIEAASQKIRRVK
jgi:competence protein ComEC